MKISKELLKGTTATLVLSVLKDRDMYGYIIIRELETRSENVFSLTEGTLYPVLHALEEEGCLEAYWEQSDGRNRKYYHITRKGLKRLEESKAEWNEYSSAVRKVLSCEAHA